MFQREENLTSNNDARENERQYICDNVLKENNYPKSFLHDYCLRCPTLTDCSSPEGDSAVKGFAMVPYIQRIAEPIRRVPNNYIKVVLKPFRMLGHTYAKPQGSHMLYTLYHAVIAKKYIWVKQNVSFEHV